MIMLDGILSIMNELKVGEIIISKQGEETDNLKKLVEIAKNKNIELRVVGTIKNGEDKNSIEPYKVNIEKDVYFDILWPNSLDLIQEKCLNNNSVVCKLNYKKFSILFTGDIEETAEKQIIKKYRNNLNILNASAIKVAHHGSRTSSIQEFIDAVKPKIALIGVGKNNNFGHPNDETIERFEKNGTKIYRTDLNGEISITVNNKGEVGVNTLIRNNKVK